MNIETRLFNLFLWLVAGAILLAMLTSCNPYAGLYPSPTATVTAPLSVTVKSIGPTLPAPTPRPTCAVTTGVPAGFLNLRTGAGTAYAVIRVLKEGETLTVTKRGAWLQVIDAQGNQGFINSKYCKG